LGGGVAYSSTASKTDMRNGYYLISDLNTGHCSQGSLTNGPYLLQGDLGLTPWIFGLNINSATNVVDYDIAGAAKVNNAVQQQISFIIATTGSFNASWTMIPVSVNKGGTLLSMSRTRNNALIITLGPAVLDASKLDKKGHPIVSYSPSSQALELHGSALISSGITSGINDAFLPSFGLNFFH
jgi:hypothetical protein